MRVKSEVFYSYFVSKVRNPGTKWRNVGSEMLDLGVAWIIVESGAYGGEDVVYVHIFLFPL